MVRAHFGIERVAWYRVESGTDWMLDDKQGEIPEARRVRREEGGDHLAAKNKGLGLHCIQWYPRLDAWKSSLRRRVKLIIVGGRISRPSQNAARFPFALVYCDIARAARQFLCSPLCLSNQSQKFASNG